MVDQNITTGKELVEDLLGKGEDLEYLRYQLSQNAVTNQQNGFQAQQWFDNALKALTIGMVGKVSAGFPAAESVSTESRAKTINDDTTLTTAQGLLDDFSKVTDTLESFTSRMSAVVEALAAASVAEADAEK